MSKTSLAPRLYEDSAGRDALRELVPLYMAAAGIGDRKVATIIADRSTNQREEEDAVRSAFKRWRAGGSREIWASDLDKTQRCARRLEEAMIAVAACQVEVEKAQRLRSLRTVGRAFVADWYRSRAKPSDLDARHAQIEGLYTTVFFHDDGDTVSLGVTANLHYFRRVPGEEFIVAHDFVDSLKNPTDTRVLMARRSGVACVLPDGSIRRQSRTFGNDLEQCLDVISPPIDWAEMPGLGETFNFNAYRRWDRVIDNNVSNFSSDDRFQISRSVNESHSGPLVAEQRYLVKANAETASRFNQAMLANLHEDIDLW